MARRILMITTKTKAVTMKNGEKYPSGVWAEEFSVPFSKFTQAGFEIDVATIDGEVPQVDVSSISEEYQKYFRPEGTYENDRETVAFYHSVMDNNTQLQHPLNVSKIQRSDIATYDAVFYVGGHGCLEDTANSVETANIGKWAFLEGKLVGIVCHGHCGILNAKDDAGEFFFKGFKMTCMSEDEEKQTRLWGQMPFVLQHRLEELGVEYSKSPILWGSYVVEDRNLITGQQPYSSREIADRMVARLTVKP
jgi:putative intracellular protease/amidase